MKHLILTATDLNNNIKQEFLNMLIKPINNIRCLFIPTAANTKEYQEMIPLYFQQLIDIGILPGNISTYNCDRYISLNELKEFDVIVFCDGNEDFLMQKINELNIADIIKQAIETKLIFIAIGNSINIALTKMKNKNGIGLISLSINLHAKDNINTGIIYNKKDIINLADNNAIIVLGTHMHIC